MRNLFIILLLFIFIIRKDLCLLGATTALTFWSKSLFPVLFPTFILVDLLLSTKFIFYITKFFGNIFKNIFKTSPYSAFVFVMSLLSGTPTNAKILKSLHDNGLITATDITKIMSFTFFFNPFLIINFAGLRVLIIIWISNIITGLILRNKYVSDNYNITSKYANFSLSDSICNNMNIIINILGSVTIFMCLSYMLPFLNPLFNTLISSFLELSTALYRNKMYLNSTHLYLVMLSLGGISIFTQIKSILKDTLIDYKFIIKSRFITLIIGLVISLFT